MEEIINYVVIMRQNKKSFIWLWNLLITFEKDSLKLLVKNLIYDYSNQKIF